WPLGSGGPGLGEKTRKGVQTTVGRIPIARQREEVIPRDGAPPAPGAGPAGPREGEESGNGNTTPGEAAGRDWGAPGFGAGRGGVYLPGGGDGPPGRPPAAAVPRRGPGPATRPHPGLALVPGRGDRPPHRIAMVGGGGPDPAQPRHGRQEPGGPRRRR